VQGTGGTGPSDDRRPPAHTRRGVGARGARRALTLDPGERLIIDTSIAIKWVFPEVDSERAAALLDHGLVAPDLLFAECANALWKKLHRGELTEEEAAIAAQTLEQVDLTVVSAKGYLGRAVAIAAALEHPAYDGIYL